MEKCLLFEGEDNYENKERCNLEEKVKTNIFVFVVFWQTNTKNIQKDIYKK